MAKTAWLGAAKPVGRVPQNGSAPTPPGKAGPRAGLRTGVAVVLVVVGVGGGVIAYRRSAQRSAVLVVGQHAAVPPAPGALLVPGI